MSSPPVPWGNVSSQGVDTTKTAYPVSDERTPVQELPFPHPKYHVRPSTGNIYETTSPILEEYDPITGYIDNVLPMMERFEVHEIGEWRPREERKGSAEWWNGEGAQDAWTGRVEYPESSERTSIEREAKRIRDSRQGKEEAVDVRRNKELRGKC
jgi:hypothetical protein